MSTPQQRLDVIEGIYNDALENEPHDLAAATNAADVTAIQTNVAVARQAYYTAVSAALTQDDSKVADAYNAAVQAQAAVDTARANSAQIPDLIAKVTSAAQAATKLLNAAQKVV